MILGNEIFSKKFGNLKKSCTFAPQFVAHGR
jgi:hypothetical protein